MQAIPRAVRELTEQFEKLPGIGPKSAQRLVFYMLHWPQPRLEEFAQKLTTLQERTIICDTCHCVGESSPCPICDDATRDTTKLMVVEQPLDVFALERSGAYNGLYHVLHGVISPMQNIGPEQLFVHDLVGRLSGVEELIMATNPTMEGEATGLYIVEYLKTHSPEVFVRLQVTRIGHGLPIGADIEYADGVTLKRALEGRRAI